MIRRSLTILAEHEIPEFHLYQMIPAPNVVPETWILANRSRGIEVTEHKMWVTEIGRCSLRTRLQALDREQIMLTVRARALGYRSMTDCPTAIELR